jgi:hypothetical protein
LTAFFNFNVLMHVYGNLSMMCGIEEHKCGHEMSSYNFMHSK